MTCSIINDLASTETWWRRMRRSNPAHRLLTDCFRNPAGPQEGGSVGSGVRAGQHGPGGDGCALLPHCPLPALRQVCLFSHICEVVGVAKPQTFFITCGFQSESGRPALSAHHSCPATAAATDAPSQPCRPVWNVNLISGSGVAETSVRGHRAGTAGRRSHSWCR